MFGNAKVKSLVKRLLGSDAAEAMEAVTSGLNDEMNQQSRKGEVKRVCERDIPAERKRKQLRPILQDLVDGLKDNKTQARYCDIIEDCLSPEIDTQSLLDVVDQIERKTHNVVGVLGKILGGANSEEK